MEHMKRSSSSKSSLSSGFSSYASGNTTLDMIFTSAFIRSMKRDPERRTTQDIQNIYATLRTFDCLVGLDQETLVYIATNGVLLNKEANEILYCRGEVAASWYILLSGAVFIEGSMFVPIATFGKRLVNSTRRNNECLILEPSDMICIDYMEHGNSFGGAHHPSRSSHSSDTSSAYSGSDTMGSSVPSDEVDLSGLVESVVDSDDDEEDIGSIENVAVRDAVRECLERYPSERTEHDINVLLEFTQHLDAFKDMTMSVRRSLCTVMVFAVCEKAGITVLQHGEELDTWSVIVHGSVQVTKPTGEVEVYTAGRSFGDFGNPPTMEKQYFHGTMKTILDDCQFVCVTQADYYRILKEGEDNQKLHRDANGEVVLVTELRRVDAVKEGHVVIRGTVEELMNQLVYADQQYVDPTYVEDFLLTHRTFTASDVLAQKLIAWFTDKELRDRVTRVVLLWVNNHFIDFETSKTLFNFLLEFQSMLESFKKMSGQLRLLQLACSGKSRIRHITISRVSRDDPLPFNIMGGADNEHRIFINHVDIGSKAEELGLRRGDEILEANGQSFESVSLSRAFEILKGATHLFVTVKCNFLGYYKCINSTIPKSTSVTDDHRVQNLHSTISNMTLEQPLPTMHKSSRNRLKEALMRIHVLPKKPLTSQLHSRIQESPMRQPDFPNGTLNGIKIDFPENVLKVFRADQTYKFLLVNKETTAREVVMLALQEFPDMTSLNSRDYSLFQVSGKDGILKQGRLPDDRFNLAERIPLGARYYIKRSDSSEQLVPTELVPDLTKEGDVTFLHLNPVELAFQLTLEDYSIFRQIEMTEFIDDLFKIDSKYGTPNLQAFAELVNRETFWVVTEVTKEPNVSRRAQIIKRFIKVATQARECKNFNSMFAVISGLGHNCVQRLKNTWEKVPGKYRTHFKEMEELMNPIRNMSKYRALVSQSSGQTPMIPFYPVVRKDLTFINEGNSKFIDNLVNFEKMRMLSREIRHLIQMSAAPYDTSCQPTMAAMNQMKSNITTTIGKRRKKSHGPPNPKKMYEEAHMIRKVKAYLQQLTVINDENLLQEMSRNCEASNLVSGGHGGSTSLNSASSTMINTSHRGSGSRNRVPSPSPSTTSSNSSESTRLKKFGTGSPGSYQKLLSLTNSVSEPKAKVTVKTSTSSSTSNNGSPPGSLRRFQLNNNTSQDKLLLSVESSSVLPGIPSGLHIKEDDKRSSM